MTRQLLCDQARGSSSWYWIGVWLGLWMALGMPTMAHAVDCSVTPFPLSAAITHRPPAPNLTSRLGPIKLPPLPQWTFRQCADRGQRRRNYYLPPWNSACSFTVLSMDGFEEKTYRGYGSAGGMACDNGANPWHAMWWNLNTERTQNVCVVYAVTRCDGTQWSWNPSQILQRWRTVQCPPQFQSSSSSEWCYRYAPNTPRFYLTAPHQPDSDLCKGNPCNPASGEKLQAEVDIRLPLSA